jgi:hypothetical protein
MLRVLAVFFFLLLSVSCQTPQHGNSSTEVQNLTKEELERRKLELETKELDRKGHAALVFGVFNEPFVTSLVTTILTLLVGGFIIGAVSNSRARKNKRLDEYHLMINNVAGDLASVFTPLYQYIRHPSHRLNPTQHEMNDKKWAERVILRRLVHERIPRIFERRLSLYVTAEALIPSKGAKIAKDYFDICRDLQQVARQLQNHAVSGTCDENKIPPAVRKNARRDVDSGLVPPFTQYEQWVAGIWIRANQLLTLTIKNPSQPRLKRLFANLFLQKQEPPT